MTFGESAQPEPPSDPTQPPRGPAALVLAALRILGFAWVIAGALVTAGSLYVILNRAPRAPIVPPEKLGLCLGVSLIIGGIFIVVAGGAAIARVRGDD